MSDGTTRRQATANAAPDAAPAPGRLVELDRTRLALLAGVDYGRIVLTAGRPARGAGLSTLPGSWRPSHDDAWWV